MAHDNVSLSSASISSVVSGDTSGRKAAQPLPAQSEVGALNGKDGVAEVKATAVAQADVASSAKSRADETQQARELQQKEMQKQAQDLQVISESKGWNVSFRVDNDLNKTIIKVVDSDTKETIRQIPSEELLSISKRIQAFRDGEDTGSDLAGLLLDRRA